MVKKTIGALNGWWAFLLKLSLVCFPMFLTASFGWGTWVTRELYRQELVHERLRSEIYREIAKLPPPDHRSRHEELDKRLYAGEAERAEIRGNQIKILTILERLEKR